MQLHKRAFTNYSEAPITFQPTYKYDAGIGGSWDRLVLCFGVFFSFYNKTVRILCTFAIVSCLIITFLIVFIQLIINTHIISMCRNIIVVVGHTKCRCCNEYKI
jgi:hypothetical protein